MRYRGHLATKFDLARVSEGGSCRKSEHRKRGYATNSVQCPCFFGTLGDAQDAAARREWRQNFATVQRDVGAREGRAGWLRALFQSALSVLIPCNYLLPVIFFNHRSPRRSAFTLTDSRRKDSARRPKHVAIFHRMASGRKRGGEIVRDAGADAG